MSFDPFRIGVPVSIDLGGIMPGWFQPNNPVSLTASNTVEKNIHVFANSANCATQILNVTCGGGNLNSPTNTWEGGIGCLVSAGFVGGAIQAWRMYTVLEYGARSSGNPTSNSDVNGKLQLGVADGAHNPTAAAYGGSRVGIDNLNHS